MAELIEMQFGMLSQVGPGIMTSCLAWDVEASTGKGTFGVCG